MKRFDNQNIELVFKVVDIQVGQHGYRILYFYQILVN